jgi:hypothetical protein
VVTEARPSRSDDIAYRQRRYLIMMGIRALCFVVAIVLFVNHAGWLTAIPIVGAIAIPYCAVVFANGGREPTGPSRFRAYEPNLPAPHVPQGQAGGGRAVPGQAAPGAPGPAPARPAAADAHRTDHGTPGGNGAPPHNA